jgi:hypothetical protein
MKLTSNFSNFSNPFIHAKKKKTDKMVKLFLFSTKHHAMKMYGGMKFSSTHSQPVGTFRTHLIRDWMGPTVHLDAVAKRNNPFRAYAGNLTLVTQSVV